jgi:hypothetical protein
MARATTQGMLPLMVSRQTYDRMMRIKVDLVEAKGRPVTNPEVGEALVELWERMLEAVDHDGS